MRINKILNNNAVIIIEDGMEKIVLGPGIAFQKSKNDIIQEQKIEKVFILKNETIALAPSTFAASYKSLGIFCKIPVVVNMENGTPIQTLIQIIVILASVESVKNGIASVGPMIPILRSIPFTGPLVLKIVLMVSSVTN